MQNLTRQYARTFFGAENEEQATRGLFGLEQNWIGEAATNSAVATTLEAWRGVKLDAPSWRRDMHEFRATVDAYVQARETYELAGEAEARLKLESLLDMGFSVDTAAAALLRCGGDVAAAAAALGVRHSGGARGSATETTGSQVSRRAR